MVEKHSPSAEARLDEIEARLGRIESVLMRLGVPVGAIAGAPFAEDVGKEEKAEKETPVAPWQHLVARQHPWRKQLYLKGRNMTVRRLVGGIKANGFTEEQAAANYHLPVEAVREALSYAEANAELLELEAAYERYLLARGGKRRAPQPVPSSSG
jgi:uncharacterized protein (DUF433 family)